MPEGSRYLILNKTDKASDYALWWKPNAAGYTCDLDRAGRYTREEYEAAVPADARSKHVLVDERDAESVVRRVVRVSDMGGPD